MSAESLSTIGSRRPGRCEDAVPAFDGEVGEARLLHGRQVGRRGRALGAGLGQRLDLAGARRRQCRRQIVEHERDAAAHQVRHGGRAAAVGDVRRLHAGAPDHELGGDVLRAAGCGRGIGDAAVLFLGPLDQLLGRVGRHAGRGHQRHAGRADQRQGLEVPDRIVGQVGKEDHVGAVGALRPQHQRVAVGRGLGGEIGADRARGAAFVLDHDALAPDLAQPRHQDARQRVGRPARRERHDPAYRAVGIGLLGHGLSRQDSETRNQQTDATTHHRSPLLFPVDDPTAWTSENNAGMAALRNRRLDPRTAGGQAEAPCPRPPPMHPIRCRA